MESPRYEDDLYIKVLTIALEESLMLQQVYAEQLNRYDGGQRMIFETPDTWIQRLRDTGKFSDFLT